MWITVTEEDIGDGIRHSFEFCPFARALSRYYHTTCFVDPLYVIFPGVVIQKQIRHTTDIVNFIKAFDNGQPVYPCSFRL